MFSESNVGNGELGVFPDEVYDYRFVFFVNRNVHGRIIISKFAARDGDVVPVDGISTVYGVVVIERRYVNGHGIVATESQYIAVIREIVTEKFKIGRRKVVIDLSGDTCVDDIRYFAGVVFSAEIAYVIVSCKQNMFAVESIFAVNYRVVNPLRGTVFFEIKHSAVHFALFSVLYFAFAGIYAADFRRVGPFCGEGHILNYRHEETVSYALLHVIVEEEFSVSRGGFSDTSDELIKVAVHRPVYNRVGV